MCVLPEHAVSLEKTIAYGEFQYYVLSECCSYINYGGR